MGWESSFLFASTKVNSPLQNNNSLRITAGKFADIRTQFERLHQLGPKYGFFLKSWKSILAVTPRNIEQVKVEFTGLNFQVQTGSRYLGRNPRKDSGRDEVLTAASTIQNVKSRLLGWRQP